jgi:hypothetical protein
MDSLPKRPDSASIVGRREHLHEMLSRFADASDINGYYHPNNIIKTEGYALGRDYLMKGKAELFIKNSLKLGVAPPSGRPVDFFSLSLRVLLADSKLSLSDTSRSKYSMQLRHAYDHNVRPEWLLPFLLMAGGYVVIKGKVEIGQREVWRGKKKPAVPYPDDMVFTAPDKVYRANGGSSETELEEPSDGPGAAA